MSGVQFIPPCSATLHLPIFQTYQLSIGIVRVAIGKRVCGSGVPWVTTMAIDYSSANDSGKIAPDTKDYR